MNEQKSFLGYNDYKEKLPEWQNGSKFTPNAESDARCKKFLVDSVNNDDILRKMMMLKLVSEGIVDSNIADIYILRKLMRK
jgi:hypothetical protein